MAALLLRTLLSVTAALAIVLLARKPVRRLFGVGPAFTLWSLPLVLAAIPWLPAPPHGWTILPSIHVLAFARPGTAAAAGDHPWHAVLLALWLLGSAAGGSRLVVHYLRLRHDARPLPPGMLRHLPSDLPGLDVRRLRLHPSGPAVLWAPRASILLPEDFPERFDTDERRLVLRHELGHVRRGDPLWNLLAGMAAALLWFHPLAWLALPRFRLDQELACDELVLRASPRDEAPYARTLLRSIGVQARPVPMQPALIPWLAEPQLKERLSMIRRTHCSATRRRLGYGCLALVVAGSIPLAQAATSGRADVPAAQAMSYNAQFPPRYPADALHDKEQGTVVLQALIHADGSVGTIAYDPKRSTTTSTDLIASASAAVKRWHFQPRMKNGKAVEGYARIPIQFSLDEPSASPTKQVDKHSSKVNQSS